MMAIGFLLDVFRKSRCKEAIVWRDDVYDYDWLIDGVAYWRDELFLRGIRTGSVVAIESDYTPNSIAIFLALIDLRCILVPLASVTARQKDEFFDISQAEFRIEFDEKDDVYVSALDVNATHTLFRRLRETKSPGLVLFSSGSTGQSKAAVHDMNRILQKFMVPRRSTRSITFLLYDHIGGVNTLLYILANGGTIVSVNKRTPDAVLRAVEKYKIDLLPTSPTFINLILLSEAYKRYDLRSLETVTYGTEPMPHSTLTRFHELFPTVRLLQTYGLSEVGILRSKSKSDSSLWVKVGGEGFETRVTDGLLQIRAESAMLGYLNASNPFTEDGWLNTGDAVEVDGEYIRILGRRSEIINVGGEKVYPAEVENVIQEMEEVCEVTVYGEKNPIAGEIVCANVTLSESADSGELVAKVKRHCRQRLERYKAPIKVCITVEKQHSERFKKVRTVGKRK